MVQRQLRAPLMAVLLVMLAACATLGIPTPQTFSQRLAVGYATVTGLRDTATTLLNADKLTVDDAENILQQTDNARAGLDVARSMVDAGAAENRLTAVLGALRTVSDYLESRR